MKLFQLLTLLLSAAIVGGEYPESSLINELTDHFRFDHHIYLMVASADANHYIDTKGSTPQSLFVFRSGDNVSNELDDVEVVNSTNPFMIVVPQSEQFDENYTLLRWMKTVPRRHMKHLKIGVFFSQYSYEDLRRLFVWCKDNSIVDIFTATTDPSSCLAECSMHIHSYNPFGEVDVINVTGGRETTIWDDVFVSRKSNFQQHQLRFGMSPFTEVEDKIWSNVLRLMNATWVVVEDNYTDPREALENGIDVFPALFPQTKVVDVNAYHIEFVDTLIVVPEALPYAEFSALLRNATSGELCGYSFVSIVAAILVLTILRHVKRKKVSILQSVADVCNLLMNDNGAITYQQLCRSELFIVVPLTFVGLIVANGILSMLQSHLTRPLLQPQINSVEDLYASPFPIIVPLSGLANDGWKESVVEVLSNRTEAKDWSRKVIVDEKYWKHLFSFNQTASFLVEFNRFEFLMRVQKRFRIKAFHNPNIKISHFLGGFRVSDRFLYFERFNDIVQRMKSAGLYDLWMRQFSSSDDSYVIEEFVKPRMNNGEGTPPVKNFEFPMFIVYGWLAGLLVFILEIVWNFVSHRWKFRRTWAE